MSTPKFVCNYGLSKIGASRVNSLAPATSKLEKNCAEFYSTWRDSELTKRRWVFATSNVTLGAAPAETPVDPYGYVFALPSDALRVLRNRRSTWMINGRFLHGYDASMTIEYVRKVSEVDFDPLFLDVLAWRIVIENAEYLTQSNTKDANAFEKYKEAVRVAGANNAFLIGPEDSTSADELDPWELARIGAYP